jgi:hypothetical protein
MGCFDRQHIIEVRTDRQPTPGLDLSTPGIWSAENIC